MTKNNDEVFRVNSTKLITEFGEFDFYCFSWGDHEEDNVLVLQNSNYSDVPVVRVQSACYSAEIFNSLDCDCQAQLLRSQELISNDGGYLIYTLCDGRGAGLMKKIEGMELSRTKGIDTSDAYRELGLQQDPRSYEKIWSILTYFKLTNIDLLTNNPRKIAGISSGGFEVTRVPIEIESTSQSRFYLEAKAKKMGHMLKEFGN